MAKKSNEYGVVLVKKSTTADFKLWASAHYKKLHWIMTCKLGAKGRDKLFRELERTLRNERIAAKRLQDQKNKSF